MNIYRVNNVEFASFVESIAFAKAHSAEVIEIATGLRRWYPATKRAPKVKHVLVNANGSETEFSRVKR